MKPKHLFAIILTIFILLVSGIEAKTRKGDKLLKEGQLDPDAETVIINSGDGLKTLDAVIAAVDVPAPIRPTLEAFQEAMS